MSSPAPRIAPRAAQPGRPLPPRPPASTPPDPTEAAPTGPGVPAARAIPAGRRARSPAQRRQAPRSLQSPRRGRVLGRAVRPRASGRPLQRRGARPARTSEAACPAEIHPPQVGGKSRAKFPRPAPGGREAPAAAAPQRNYAIRTRRGLSPPAGSSGNRAGKVAAHPSRRLPSVTRWEEESATRRPRNPRLPPSGRPRAPAPPTLAGGDGQEATAISARGEGRSSSAVPTALPAAQKLLLPPPASALSSPFSSAAGGRTPRAAGACVSFRTEEGGRAAEPREPPGCRAPSLGQRTQRGRGSGKGRMGARGQRGREPQRFPPSYEVLAAFQGFLANLVYLVPCVLVQKCKTSNSVVTPPCPPPSKAPPTPLRAVPGALSRCALTAVFPPANG